MAEVLTPESVPFNGRALIGHGFHAGELGMRKLYDSLAHKHVDRLDHTILSPAEWEAGERLVGGENLSTVSPDPNGTRAQRIVASYGELASEYDLAMHPHGIPVPGSELAIYGANASPLVRGAVSYFGLRRAIIRPSGVEAERPNTVSFEIGDDASFLSVAVFREKLLALMDGALITPAPIEEYVYLANIGTETARRLDLQPRYETFEPLTRRDTIALNRLLGKEALELELFACGWDAKLFDPTGFRGELLGRYSLPSDVSFYDQL
ncbi:MAG TPA: hypothetical protein VLF59_02085 [Candidatus Saccharimonadales bacterium]|nr:hypothetical protein [Candidatus Saccharimonadales bacterium]